MLLNIVFHNVALKEDEIENTYTVTLDYYKKFIRELNTWSKESNIDYRIYFDDGYVSFYNFIYPEINEELIRKYTLTIITELTDTQNYLIMS